MYIAFNMYCSGRYAVIFKVAVLALCLLSCYQSDPTDVL